MNDSLPPILHDADHSIFYTDGGARLNYSREPGILSIDHVFVPEHLRGQNLAARLVKQAVAYSDSMGTKIRPLCSYAKAFLKRTVQLHDSIAEEFRPPATPLDESQSN